MPVPTETFWNIRKVSIVFAISSVALLASLVWLIKVDYARPWRAIQNQFTDQQASLAYFEVLALQTPESLAQYEAAKAGVAHARQELERFVAEAAEIAAGLRDGLKPGAEALARKIVDHIRGVQRTAYETRARRIDSALGEVVARQAETPDPEALAGQLQTDSTLVGRLAELFDWFNLKYLEARATQLRGEHARAELEFKNLKSERGVLLAAFEHEKGLHGPDAPGTKEAQARLAALDERYEAARLRFETLADERKEIEDQQKLLLADVTRAEKTLARIEKERNDIQKKYADLSNTLHRGIFNLPLLDFAAPKGTPGRNEIKQVVLPDVRVELHFVQSYATDRCMTCHVAIDDRNFTKENLARRLEKAIASANEELWRNGEPLLMQPTVPGRDDLPAGQVAEAWNTLTREQQEAFFAALKDQINIYQARRGAPLLEFGQPLLAHPNLDLFVSPHSPHPMSKVGCTVCHEGNGEETDFVLAAHTPKTPQERREWEEKYYVRTAGLVPEIDFHTAEHHWTRPMLPPQYSEAGCTKCHAEVADIAEYNGQPAARRINEGRFLFTSLGCVNCHLVEGMGDSRRVGPGLSHVGEKVTPGWMQNWIFFPADFRPSTNMPHYFLQENNDAHSETAGGDPDPEARTRAEVLAISEYLMRVSTPYEQEKLPEDLWEPLRDEESEAAAAARDRGRRLFGSVGCLACHSALAYRPNNEEGVAGEPIGQTWITNDLVGRIEGLIRTAQLGKARKIKKDLITAALRDGRDPAEVKLEGDEIAQRLAVVLDEGSGDDIALPKILSILVNSFRTPAEGDTTDADAHGHKPARRQKARPASEEEPAARAVRLASGHYDADAARRAVFAEIVKVSPEAVAGITLDEDEEGLAEISDEAYESILTFAGEQYDAMTYVDRVQYAMNHFKNAYDTILDPDSVSGPVFTRFAPELSSVGTKFESYEKAVQWLYDWLRNPRHYSSYTKMPRMRLTRGQTPVIDLETGEIGEETIEADEALDLAVYLASLRENEAFPTEPFDADDAARQRLAEMRDAMILNLLGGLNSQARSRAILNDEGGEMTEQLVAKLARSLGEEEARARVTALDLEQRRWVFLGDKMIGHYGCYACHQIRGYETAARPGTELTSWGEKQLAQLDFAFFEPEFREHRERDPLFRDLYPQNRTKLIRWSHRNPPEQVEHTLASFAWHKLRNPRIWDRRKAKAPYEKLRMPNFFLDDRQTDALVTFLLSRRPARVSPSIQVDYDKTPEGMIARGRNLAWELNCVACHRIDQNRAVVHQYFEIFDGNETVFDEVNAPPWLRGQGSKVQAAWLYGFLNDVQMLRPWLRIRMPSFHLTPEESRVLVEYFFGLSQHESQWLADRVGAVHRYLDEAKRRAGAPQLARAGSKSREDGPGGGSAEGDAPEDADAAKVGADWYVQPQLASVAEDLRRYAVRNRLVQPSALDSAGDAGELEAVHEKILQDAAFLARTYDVPYPFTESPLEATPELIHDGEVLFTELRCLACHVFGDPSVPGANAAPTAPNLQLASDRLRREWVHRWLESPGRLQPGTKMPNVFGQTRLASAFADYPADARANIERQLKDKAMLDDPALQIRALTAFLYYAGDRRLDKVQPPDETGATPEDAAEDAAEPEGETDAEASAETVPATETSSGEDQ